MKQPMVDVQPLKDALIAAAPKFFESPDKQAAYRDGANQLGRVWARVSGRNEKTCQRYIARVFQEFKRVTVYKADEVCIELLGIQPELIYGTEFFTKE